MTPNELALLRDLIAQHQEAVFGRFDTVDQDNDGINKRLDALNGRLRKVEQSNTRLKVIVTGLSALALGWLKTTLHL